jgi:hypothetical protein
MTREILYHHAYNILMMEAVSASEISVGMRQTTRCYIPEFWSSVKQEVGDNVSEKNTVSIFRA